MGAGGRVRYPSPTEVMGFVQVVVTGFTRSIGAFSCERVKEIDDGV